jgi:hypothetical protein
MRFLADVLAFRDDDDGDLRVFLVGDIIEPWPAGPKLKGVLPNPACLRLPR